MVFFSEELAVADTFNKLFRNVVKESKIEKNDKVLTDIIEETDPALKGIKK